MIFASVMSRINYALPLINLFKKTKLENKFRYIDQLCDAFCQLHENEVRFFIYRSLQKFC